jgi:hypothetical protein
MQPLYKIAEHNGLQDVVAISFKKRSKILEALKEKNNEAWTIVNNFIETQIKLDRIQNDKEKQEKNLVQWEVEITVAENEKQSADEELRDYCKSNNIPV